MRFVIARAESQPVFFLLRESAMPMPMAAPTAIPIQILVALLFCS
jgi:hypothetical protein